MQGFATATDERPQAARQTLQRTLIYFRPYGGRLLGILALVLVSAVVQGLGPALIGHAIDVAIANKDRAGLAQTMLFLLITYLVGFQASSNQTYQMGWVAQHFISELRTQLFDKVQTLPLSFFDRIKAGDVMSRLVNDTSVIGQLLNQGFVQAISSVFGLVGIIFSMLILSWKLALVSYIVIPLMIGTTIFFADQSRRAFRQTRTAIGAVSEELEEELAGVRVAQAFNRTGENVERFAVRNAANRDANVQAVAVTSAFSPTIDVLSTVATAIVALYGGWLAIQGQLPVGTVVAFFLYVQQFFRPIQMVSSIYTQAQSALAGAERIYSLLDATDREVDVPTATELPPIQGRVTFEHVEFAYLGGEPVLHDVNLEAQAGQTVAIVGPTGAGKSTLVNLIGRFYVPTAGRVLIDGQDVLGVQIASLRRQMGIVLQENFLFSGTIAENIRYGRLDATDAEVAAAARAVSADEFIATLPQGYATRLGERGGGLSQGQRQLLSFARAVLADPRILILDEATSSVDTRTEAIIQEALKTLLKGRTSFVIAHRLSTVRDADLVLVLDQGRIVERGTHDALLAQGGLYADLYQRQFRDTPAVVR
jgi:ATP-binding cassette subfamily B protein/subfamily B ATP-binding cassette protein MsbA